MLKETLRGRAALLLVDRTDVATAAEADGVLLTNQGEMLLLLSFPFFSEIYIIFLLSCTDSYSGIIHTA